MREDRGEYEELKERILEGIARDRNSSDIAKDIGVSRWTLKKEIRKMRYMGDSELSEAKKARQIVREDKQDRLESEKKHVKLNKRFKELTGMTLEERSFRNMIEFYTPELLKAMRSSDQNSVIEGIPKAIRRTMKKNQIITKTWNTYELTPEAKKYLANIK